MRRFIHEPMAGAPNDDALDVVGDHPALVDEKLSSGLLAGQHQHRHRQLGLGIAGEVPGVALERPEHLETGAHRTGLGISLGIDAAIALRDRLAAVGGEIAPEMLEVYALPA